MGCRGESPPCPQEATLGGDAEPHRTLTTDNGLVLAPCRVGQGGLRQGDRAGGLLQGGCVSATGCHW